MGIELTPEYAEEAVKVYRNSYPEIVHFWWDLQDALVSVIEKNSVVEMGYITLRMRGKVLCVTLPSGRDLHYVNPMVTYEDRVSKKGRKYKASIITCDGIDQITRQWQRIDTRGPKVFENVVQAICRDVLGCGMIEAEKIGFDIVLHCHDEIVAEVDEDSPLTEHDLVKAMVKEIRWAPNFILGAEGFESPYYAKEKPKIG